jgi:hypothetical protein
MRSRKTSPAKNNHRAKEVAPRRQLIGEQVGATRLLQMRLFKNSDEAEKWVKAGQGRRLRWVRNGSLAWIRALDAELTIVSGAERKHPS